MQIADKMVVTIDYTLKDDEGTVLDSSTEGNLAYLQGAHKIIPGLENALTGRSAGDEVEVSVSPAEGYGERNDSMIQAVPRDMFDSEQEIQVGMQFHAQSREGDIIVVTVTDVEDDNITVDGKVAEKRFDLVLSHVLRMFFIMETNILQNPADVGFLGIVGVMVKTKDFTNLIHQANGFRHELPCRLAHVSISLYCSSFVHYRPNRGKEELTYYKKYGESIVLISPS